MALTQLEGAIDDYFENVVTLITSDEVRKRVSYTYDKLCFK